MGKSKWHHWIGHYGKAHVQNAKVPRDHWLLESENQAILDFYHEHPYQGYRRLTFMMLDHDIVYVSQSSVYWVLSQAGLLQRHNRKPSSKRQGFVQPLGPHERWHIDIAYVNFSGTFYYLCSVLDGCSRYVVHWELRESMTEEEGEGILQRGHERYPEETPRIITDNGPQFVAKDVKEFIRICAMSHVRTSPY